MNNFLTAPMPFRRGLRQGCSLSAVLYILMLEPLLNLIRESDQIHGLICLDQKIKISAYADDITILITSDSSWALIQQVFSKYECASNAKITFEWYVVWGLEAEN